jgi:hypothetical protein
MTIYPLSWLSPTRIGVDVENLLNRSATLARVMMALLVDDGDGDEATQTIPFAYRGVEYEIDLSEREVTALDAVLAPYVENARPVMANRTKARRPIAKSSKSSKSAKSGVPADPSQVRAWAKAQGIAVADRGRVSADVMRQYRDAHGG